MAVLPPGGRIWENMREFWVAVLPPVGDRGKCGFVSSSLLICLASAMCLLFFVFLVVVVVRCALLCYACHFTHFAKGCNLDLLPMQCHFTSAFQAIQFYICFKFYFRHVFQETQFLNAGC